MTIRIKLICITCGEIFSRHSRKEECPYCGGALLQHDFDYTTTP